MTEQRDRGVSRRLEQEIEEILARAGDLGQGPARPHLPPKAAYRPAQDTRKWSPGSAPVGSWWSRLHGTSRLMLLAVFLTIVAFVAFSRVPTLGVLCTVLAVACFIWAYLLAFRGPRNLGSDRRWRGQPIDYRGTGAGDLGVAFRRWWERLTRRP